MGPYTAAHVNPQGAGDARPTALQPVRDEGIEGKLDGKAIVITGAGSGIGFETARALSLTGAALFLTARNVKMDETALAGLVEVDRVSLVEMDNSAFASIRTAAGIILQKSNNRVNILVNNAGVMEVQMPQTHRGWSRGPLRYEFTSASSSWFKLLKPALLAGATRAFHSRVVNISSSAHRTGRLPEGDSYNCEKGGYSHEASVCEFKGCL